MTEHNPRKPSRQMLRTRREILRAAESLIRAGHRPTMEEIADAALVSRATIYRYYSSLEALLAEILPHEQGQEGETLFAGNPPQDPQQRIAMVEEFFHRLVYDNEALIRVHLASAILSSEPGSGIPVRQNRRLPLIEEALQPVRKQLSRRVYDSLCSSLAFVIGTESMIVCQDVIHIDREQARVAKDWAVRALLQQALANPGKK